MKPLKQDLSILNKFKFEKPPVGIKFLFFRPEGMAQLSMDKNLSFCELLIEAQQTRTPFYFSNENSEACVGKILLGMEEYGAICRKRANWTQIRNLSGTTC